MKQMIVTVVKTIQLRTQWTGVDGEIVGFNKKFQKPSVAADHWARDKVRKWENKMYEHLGGASYHHLTNADHIEAERRFKVLKRRATRVFKRVLES
jgi:hypothetical protein